MQELYVSEILGESGKPMSFDPDCCVVLVALACTRKHKITLRQCDEHLVSPSGTPISLAFLIIRTFAVLDD